MLHDEECYSISYLKYVTSTLGYRDKKKIFCVCSNAGPIGQHLYSDRILLVSSDDFTIAARRVDHQDIHQSNMQCNARCAKIVLLSHSIAQHDAALQHSSMPNCQPLQIGYIKQWQKNSLFLLFFDSLWLINSKTLKRDDCSHHSTMPYVMKNRMFTYPHAWLADRVTFDWRSIRCASECWCPCNMDTAAVDWRCEYALQQRQRRATI